MNYVPHAPTIFDREQLERSLVARLSSLCTAHGDLLALRDAESSLTYRQLESAVAGAADALAGDDAPVALLLEHGTGTVVALLGAIAAGRPYVPLDPTYPRAQLEHMLADSGAKQIVGQGPTLQLARELARDAALLDLSSVRPGSRSLAEHAARTTADSRACILYTSGSTGMPKGIVHTHRTIQHLVWSHVTSYGLGPGDKLSLVFSTSFAASLSEIFGAVLTGASLSLTSAKKIGMGALAAWLCSEGITVLKVPISLFRVLLRSLEPAARFPDVRLVLLGGDSLFRKDVEKARAHFRPDCPLVNRLTSSEALSITRYPIDRSLRLGEEVVPVGYADHDTEVSVVDDDGRPLPPGELGQVAVRSRYLSPGYWRRDELTRSTYLPGTPEDPRVTLLTGDLGRLRPDGCLEHFGRRDAQVKLRGYRVELPAVEAALCALDTMREAAASLVAADGEGDVKRLVGYVVPAPGRQLSVGALRAALARTLPDFMIPSAFVVLDTLPHTPTGKLDRRALPAPQSVRPLLDGAYVRPRTEIERRLVEIWAEVLGQGTVGVHDNFFDLGGDSLHLLRVHARLRQAFGLEVPVVELFARPTVAAVATWLLAPRQQRPEPRPAAPVTVAPLVPERAVAVIGMAGVFPGAADLERFWANLRDGVESLRTWADDELRAAGVDPLLLADPTYVRTAPELPELKLFDAGFFGLSPLEAALLDPAHRLLLECAWHALEDAGHAPGKYAGRVGVYAGTSPSAYLVQHLLPQRDRLPAVSDLQLRLATDPEFLATRIAYKLDLKGPALSVSTACSTSLVAIHLACKALLDGECELALAGGSSVESPEPAGYRFQDGWITSRDGRCRPFDSDAQGTVFGSGAGMVVLKRLDRALADGDTVRAVVRGSALNNDGAVKVGFAAPSVDGQASVVAAAQAAAGVPGDAIEYVETHGTGTPLGDPIEIAALTRAFRQSTERSGFCALGSLKSNVGHLSRAAGVAGFVKAVLTLEHREIPPSLHFEHPNPQIAFERTPFFVAASLRAWEARPDQPRRAAVSSFGVGGTNAHAILEEWPRPAAQVAPEGPALLLVSAQTDAALAASERALQKHLERHSEAHLHDVAFTLQAGRQDFAQRRAIVARDRDDALRKLGSGAGPTRRHVGSPPSLVFMFPGQGAQYVQMARGIYDGEPSFRADVDRCAEILRPHLGLDLRGILFPPLAESRAQAPVLKQTRVTQPALFVVEWALARLLVSWGLRPDAMIGHSIGEHAAACVAGMMDVEPTLELIARRGELIQSLPAGHMLVVHLSEAEALSLCSETISLAAVNAPTLCVLAGPEDAIDSLARTLAERAIDHHLLHTSHAFHSAMMEPALEDFTREVARHRRSAPEISYVSGVTGRWLTPEDAAAPDYWSRLLRGTVRFSAGLRTLSALENAVLLEVGPGRSLATLARQHEELGGHTALATLRTASEERPDRELLLETLGELWLHGVPIDWEAVHRGRGRRRIPLPGYPFERREYWVPRPRVAGTPREARSPLALGPAEPASIPQARTAEVVGAAPPLDAILGAPATERSERVSEYLARTLNTLLGHPESRPLDPSRSLSDLGFDSLASIRLRERLHGDLRVAVPIAALLKSTVASLARVVAERVDESGRGGSPTGSS